MKTLHALLLAGGIVAAGGVGGLLAGLAEQDLDAARRNPAAVYSGTPYHVYWWKGDEEIEGYTQADEGYFRVKGASVTTFTGSRPDVTVYPNWIIIRSPSGTTVVPREKIVSLEFRDEGLDAAERAPSSDHGGP